MVYNNHMSNCVVGRGRHPELYIVDRVCLCVCSAFVRQFIQVIILELIREQHTSIQCRRQLYTIIIVAYRYVQLQVWKGNKPWLSLRVLVLASSTTTTTIEMMTVVIGYYIIQPTLETLTDKLRRLITFNGNNGSESASHRRCRRRCHRCIVSIWLVVIVNRH